MDEERYYKRFPSKEACLSYLEEVLWDGSPVCPYCKSTNTTVMVRECRHHCNRCKTSFSVTVGTIFHRTRVDLRKWFIGISILLNTDKITTLQLAHRLDVNKNTAWYIKERVRKELRSRPLLLYRIVEGLEL